MRGSVRYVGPGTLVSKDAIEDQASRNIVRDRGQLPNWAKCQGDKLKRGERVGGRILLNLTRFNGRAVILPSFGLVWAFRVKLT